MTEFADISSFQKGADLAAYLRSGVDRIMIKATEGATYTNPYFREWWQWADRLGLARGAYHFARPSRSAGAAEADHFAGVVRAAGGLGPRDWVCLDAEDPDDHANAGGRHAAEFCDRMARIGLPAGVIYTGTWYAQPVGLTAALLPAGWRQLHLATYNTAIADASMPLPPGWSRDQVVARQYTSTAGQPGIPGRSDRSRVLREWLPPLEDDVTPEEYAAAMRPGGPIYEQAFKIYNPATEAPIAQPDVGRIWASTYRKTGDIQAALTRIESHLGTGPVRVTLPDTLDAIAATTDPHMLVQLITAAGAQLGVVLGTPTPSPSPQEPTA